jgi:hypothetical protein
MSSESKVITATSEVDIFHFDPAVKDLIEGDAAAKSYGEVCECHECTNWQYSTGSSSLEQL